MRKGENHERNFFPPELRETLVGPEEQLPSGWDIYRVGDDLYSVTLPDGRKVVVDRSGNIIG